MDKIFYKKNISNGFTLVEALVAISILMVAVAGPITIAQRGLSTAVFSKDQMTASFLVQDGIEAVKNIRDQVSINQDPQNPDSSVDWISGSPSVPSGLGNCICTDDASCNFDSPTAIYCNIDTTNNPLNSSSVISYENPTVVNPLRIKSVSDTGAFIKYDLDPSNPASRFSRKINIRMQTINGKPDEAIINVRVSWGSILGIQNFDLKDFIYNYSASL